MRDGRLGYAALFFMLLTILSGCEQNSRKEPPSRTVEKKEAALIPAENRRMMPDFSLTAVQDGSMVSNQNFLGRVSVVAFFSPWCSDCVSEMGMLEKLQSGPRGAEFSAVGMAAANKDNEGQP